MRNFFSPAKINLFLRVLSRRPDGYHILSSVLQTLAFGDTLSFAIAGDEVNEDILTCSDPLLPTNNSNLIKKAIDLFRRKTGAIARFRVHLDKKIPMQAGLGGGSSNAATTLWACNQLLGLQIPVTDLRTWGVEIGADVPFFFSEGTAYCTGIGEKVTSLQPLPKNAVTIVKPSIGLSTPEIFRRLHEGKIFEEQLGEKDLYHFSQGEMFLFNDLEQVAFKIHPELERLKNTLLKKSFSSVVMTGSGSSFACLGEADLAEMSSDVKVFATEFANRDRTRWYGE
jgi:4-diphosphocytidyl-2-C-methyl-D-erythritol kinase